jgi:hypothetical protein
MKVIVDVLGREVGVEVGEGKQHFKWLAQVISAKIKLFKILRSTYEDEKHLVVALRNRNGQLLDPHGIISDTIEDGAFIKAEVSDEISSDTYGNPTVPQWLQDAYVQSSAGVQFARGREAWDRNPSRMRTATAQDTGSDALVFAGELTDADIFSAIELDWPIIDWSWVSTEHPTEEFLYSMKDCLKMHYAVICHLFTAYAGVGLGM